MLRTSLFAFVALAAVALGCDVAPPNFGVPNESLDPHSSKPVDAGIVITDAGEITLPDAAPTETRSPASP